MSLLKAVEEAAKESRKGPRCTVGQALLALSPKDAKELRALLDGPTHATILARALTKIGHKMHSTTIGRHRRGDCGCAR